MDDTNDSGWEPPCSPLEEAQLEAAALRAEVERLNGLLKATNDAVKRVDDREWFYHDLDDVSPTFLAELHRDCPVPWADQDCFDRPCPGHVSPEYECVWTRCWRSYTLIREALSCAGPGGLSLQYVHELVDGREGTSWHFTAGELRDCVAEGVVSKDYDVRPDRRGVRRRQPVFRLAGRWAETVTRESDTGADAA